jgi:hypothetical protein
VNCGRQLSPTAKFCPGCAQPTGLAPQAKAAPRFTSPNSYIPKHLAERILTSKAALEGERKQVTVLFADLKGSMELLADRDPDTNHGIAPSGPGGGPELHVRWKDPKHLLLQHHAKARVFKAERGLNGIEVRYEPIP